VFEMMVRGRILRRRGIVYGVEIEGVLQRFGKERASVPGGRQRGIELVRRRWRVRRRLEMFLYGEKLVRWGGGRGCQLEMLESQSDRRWRLCS